MKTKAHWKCIYCDYHSISKRRVAYHEKFCDLNPNSRTCLTCQYRKKEVRYGVLGCTNPLVAGDKFRRNCTDWMQE